MFSTRLLLLVFLAGFIAAGPRAQASAEEPQTFTNSVGMKLVLIPAGEFVMGSPETELGFAGKHLEEEKQRLVKIEKPFYMGVYEVTLPVVGAHASPYRLPDNGASVEAELAG